MPTEEHENAIEWIAGQRTCTVTLWSGKQQNRVAGLCKKHPDKAKVIAWPEENGGFLLARIPLTWLRFAAPLRRELTEEEKAVARERLEKARTASRKS